jgi:hypothetical protein
VLQPGGSAVIDVDLWIAGGGETELLGGTGLGSASWIT